MKKITLKIFRYKQGETPYYQDFRITCAKGMTILDCLKHIRSEHDNNLAFQGNCNCAKCGSCAVRINHHPKLACKTLALEQAGSGEILIEPLSKRYALKDLVISKDRFWQEFSKVRPYLINKPSKELPIIKRESIVKIRRADKCIMCAVCYYGCSVSVEDKDYAGPAALVKLYRFVSDPRDRKKRRRLKIGSRHLWSCANIFNCMQNCPVGIKPADRISDLKEMAFKEKINNRGTRLISHTANSIYRTGKLIESTISINVKGIMASVFSIGPGLKSFIKGRSAPLFMERVPSIKDVKRIFRKINIRRKKKGL